jgi:hypothetical protein
MTWPALGSRQGELGDLGPPFEEMSGVVRAPQSWLVSGGAGFG